MTQIILIYTDHLFIIISFIRVIRVRVFKFHVHMY